MTSSTATDPAAREAGPIRVFLVDDHEVVRRGLRDMLTDAGIDVVGEAGTASEAVGRILAVRPDVAVLDVRLPDGDGVAVCREILSKDPAVRCLMLTSYVDDDALVRAGMAGASGYVVKRATGFDLVRAVRQVGAGGHLLDRAEVQRALERIARAHAEDPSVAALTPQERRVFHLIGEGRTNRDIAVELSISEKTVKNYVSALMAKLGMHRRADAILYASRRRDRPEQGVAT